MQIAFVAKERDIDMNRELMEYVSLFEKIGGAYFYELIISYICVFRVALTQKKSLFFIGRLVR